MGKSIGLPLNNETYTCKPIGYFHSSQKEKYLAPKQSAFAEATEGKIELLAAFNFEQALADLEGFERIWVLYWFHCNTSWKAMVSTPRIGPKRGVFATRSPHRPNPIGLSCVELLGIKGRQVIIGKSDLLDGTPILDIKPYVTYADAFPTCKQGWLKDMPPEHGFEVEITTRAQKQVDFIESHWNFPLYDAIVVRLKNNPYPHKNHRIKRLANGSFELAVKTWRVQYTIYETHVSVQKIYSGYDQDTLSGKKASRWDDVPLHLKFNELFSP